jgi:hypothetical protein
MQTTTLSGPADTVREARAALAVKGYFVLSAARAMGLELAEGEAFLSVDGMHSDVASAVERLGWRHRACIDHPRPLTKIGSVD